jgi:hypothetical protein
VALGFSLEFEGTSKVWHVEGYLLSLSALCDFAHNKTKSDQHCCGYGTLDGIVVVAIVVLLVSWV